MISTTLINMLDRCCTKILQLIAISTILYFTGIGWIIIGIDIDLDFNDEYTENYTEKFKKYSWLLRNIPAQYIFYIFTIGNIVSGGVGCFMFERISEKHNPKCCSNNIFYFYTCVMGLTLSVLAIMHLTIPFISFTIISHYFLCALLISMNHERDEIPNLKHLKHKKNLDLDVYNLI